MASIEWIKDTSQFNEDLIKNYNKECNEGYLLKDTVQYLEKLHELDPNKAGFFEGSFS